MADNRFKSTTAILTTVKEIVYTAPVAYNTIVISCQVANTSNSPARVTLNHFTSENNQEISLVKDFEIAGNDAYQLTLGRLVVNEGDSILAASDTDAPLRLILSLLETG